MVFFGKEMFLFQIFVNAFNAFAIADKNDGRFAVEHDEQISQRFQFVFLWRINDVNVQSFVVGSFQIIECDGFGEGYVFFEI